MQNEDKNTAKDLVKNLGVKFLTTNHSKNNKLLSSDETQIEVKYKAKAKSDAEADAKTRHENKIKANIEGYVSSMSI